MSNLQFSSQFNSSGGGQCVLQECNQFSATDASAFLSNENPISKLATDDYMSELDPDHHLISSLNLVANNRNHHNNNNNLSSNNLSNSLSNKNPQLHQPLSANSMDQQADARQISSQSNPQEISPNPHSSTTTSQNNTNQKTTTNQNASQNANQNASQTNTSQTNKSNQPNSNFQIERNHHNNSPPPPQTDSDDAEEGEEVFEEAGSSTDDEPAAAAAKSNGTRPIKSECLDIETMRTHLVKLKLSKDLAGSPGTNAADSPLTGELNEDADFAFFDAIDDYEEENERGPMIRSTSLKTGKAKSLGPKKTLRFADALGLDLAKVKNISQEDLPNVPASAFRDLKMCKREVKEEFFNNQLSCSPVRSSYLQGNRPPTTGGSPFFGGSSSGQFNRTPLLSNGLISAGSDLITPASNWPILVPEFVQPFTQFNFLERVRSQRVCLESCVVSSIGNNLSIDCIIRVLNVSFEKMIMVRHTANNWSTWLDALASYIPNSSDGQTDKFSVKFYIKSLTKGQRVKFAIIYLVNSEEYWDNNLGIDYCLLYKT